MINGGSINSFVINGAPSGGAGTYNESINENITVADLVEEHGGSVLETLLDDLQTSELISSIPIEEIFEALGLADQGYGHNLLYSDTFLEDINLVQTQVVVRLISLIENLTLTSSLVTDVIFGLGEDISASDTLTTNAIVGNILNSSVSIDDVIRIILEGSILDDVTLTLSQSVYVASLNRITDVVNSTSSLDTKLEALSQIALTFTVADAIIFGYFADVNENIDLTHTSLEIVEWFTKLIEGLTVSLTDSNILLLVGILADDFTVDDTSSFSQEVFETILEGITMISLSDQDDTYSGWVLNPETFAIWNYDNYNFNSMATLGGTTFLANSSGLFTMEGTLDDTAFIESRLKTKAFDFGSSNLKQVPDMYIGMTLVGEMVIGVTTDERVNVKYKLTTPSTVQELQTVKLGKGLRGNLWQFELIDDGATQLDITSIEWVPIVFGRKRR